MDLDREVPSADEYFVTALQIFDYCGTESSGTLRVDALMEKLAPFVKTSKAEYSCLKSILDPDQDNPEIDVTKLAKALLKYSETQKTKVDLEESFNLKSGHVPQDSDSGISTDGFQLLEELQSELREKTHLAHQLRSQLDFTDRQHEEALGTLIAERDSVRAHLNMLRDENMTLVNVKRDYEDACDRLCNSEQALADARRELDSVKKKARVLHEQISTLENEKLTLQELLTKSKDECHRINEMYAARQSTLLEENETLKTEHADLTSRLQDHEEFVQQMTKEKVLLEMELKDVLNKSNQTHLRMDRSIDVSYSEDQMLTTLDSLTADSRFTQEHRLLDEESFSKALIEDQGRPTNMSLFDEIRLSFYNTSRHNLTDFNNLSQYDKSTNFDASYVAEHTHADLIENQFYDSANTAQTCSDHTAKYIRTPTYENIPTIKVTKARNYCSKTVETQTSDNHLYFDENDIDFVETHTIETQTDSTLGIQITKAQNCLMTDDIHTSYNRLYLTKDDDNSKSVETQKFDSMSYLKLNELQNDENKTVNTQINDNQIYVNINKAQTKTEGTQTIENQSCFNKNSVHSLKCLECEKASKYTINLERGVKLSHFTLKDMQSELDKYEESMNELQKFIREGNDRNTVLQSIIKNLQAKVEILEVACKNQREMINGLSRDTSCVECQTDSDLVTVGTQAEAPCIDCEKRKVVTPQRNLRRFFWEPLKCLFQLFAVICFLCAVSVLYGVTRRWHAPCKREPLPWRWLDAQDLMDLLLRIEYVADVPM